MSFASRSRRGVHLQSGGITSEVLRSYTLVEKSNSTGTYTFPGMYRKAENRKVLIVQNLHQTSSLQVCYKDTSSYNFNTPSAAQWSAGYVIPPNQEEQLPEDSRTVFIRPNVSGESLMVGIYAEVLT